MGLLGRIARTFRRPPDFYIGGRENPYLLRWHVIPRNRFMNVYLHKFMRDDDDRALHDHPWASVSVALRGTYVEYTKNYRRVRWAGSIVFRSSRHAHRIVLTTTGGKPDPAWTLFVTGPKVREWGFHCPKGWRHWREFVSETDIGNVSKGCD